VAGLRQLCVASVVCGLLALPGAASAAAGGGSVAPSGGGGSAAASGGLDTSAPPPATSPPANPAPASGGGEVPTAYARLYRQAAQRYGLDWRLLAAIGKNESDHGRSTARGVRSGLNFARCCAGPMQLCTVTSCGSTWQSYAVDGDRDGRLSVYAPADAIFTAARLLASLRGLVGARSDFLLASYNAGPAYVVRHGRIPPYSGVREYVSRGVRYMRSL
jgi:soluble lytic murein transglycosylase-like protein